MSHLKLYLFRKTIPKITHSSEEALKSLSQHQKALDHKITQLLTNSAGGQNWKAALLEDLSK